MFICYNLLFSPSFVFGIVFAYQKLVSLLNQTQFLSDLSVLKCIEGTLHIFLILIVYFRCFPFCLLGFLFNHLRCLQKLRYLPLVLVSHQSVALKSFVLYVLYHFVNLSNKHLPV